MTDQAEQTPKRAPNPLSADKPLADPGDDRLGYAPFAAAVAKAITDMQPAEGMVIAVNGQWGLGKSTIVNFIRHEIAARRPDDVIVLPFYPWWFSGRTDVATAFLGQLQGLLKRRKVLTDKARDSLTTFFDTVGAVPEPPVGGLGRFLSKVMKRPEEDVPKLKGELADALRQQEKLILVVIDDIDRLTGDELAALFGAVKALADFPNVIYLLAFDKDKVSRTLGTRLGEPGSEYLEKIVQYAADVPRPESAALREMFVDELAAVVGAIDEDLFDQSDFHQTLLEGIAPLLDTPRDVVKLTNALRVSYAALAGDVNLVDLVALETVRFFSPPVYELVQRHPEKFGVAMSLMAAMFGSSLNQPQQQAFHKEWVDALPPEHREPITALVGRLFPDAHKALPGHVGGGSGPADHYKARRICVPSFFPAYFRLGLGDQIAPRNVVHALVAQAQNPAALGQSLLEMISERVPSGRSRASVMLDELAAQADRFDASHIGPVIETLVDIGDDFGVEADLDDMGFIDNGTRLTHLIAALLRRLAPEQRVETLTRAITNARSTLLPILLVHRLEKGLGVPEHGSVATTPTEALRPENGLIEREPMQLLEQLARQKVSDRMRAGELWGAPRFQYLLRKWYDWGGAEDAKSWLDKVRADDDQLAQFLTSCNSKTRITSAGRGRLDPAEFDEYVPRAEMAADVRRLLGSTTTPEVTSACEQYLEELALRDDGQDPEMVYWD